MNKLLEKALDIKGMELNLFLITNLNARSFYVYGFNAKKFSKIMGQSGKHKNIKVQINI